MISEEYKSFIYYNDASINFVFLAERAMRTKSTYLTILFCSLTIFSWLILTEAHPVDDDIEKSLGFTSNEVSSYVRNLKIIHMHRGELLVSGKKLIS